MEAEEPIACVEVEGGLRARGAGAETKSWCGWRAQGRWD